MSTRTALTGLLLSAAVLAPLPAEPQQAGRVHRIGYLGNGTATTHGALLTSFRNGLEELGWVDGRNISIEVRWADGDLSRHPALIGDLVNLRVEVIVLAGTSATQAARRATGTIPIVSAIMTDPVGVGFAASLARPGGNVTGLANQFEDLITKQAQLLREAVPNATRVGILFSTGMPVALRTTAEAAARALGLQARVLEIRDMRELDGAFRGAQTGRIDAMHVLPSPSFNRHRARLAELAVKHRVPAIYEAREYVDAGGLMSYGPSFPDMYRRAASYVHRILKGARPGDLPIEQPTKFELAINQKAASLAGMTVPPSLLLRADHVSE